MRLGIIGLPGSGKSTVFDALTQSAADGGHRGEDRIGTIRVPDARVEVLSRHVPAPEDHLCPGGVFSSRKERTRKEKRPESVWTPAEGLRCPDPCGPQFQVYGMEAPYRHGDVVPLTGDWSWPTWWWWKSAWSAWKWIAKRGKTADPEEKSLLGQCRERSGG